MSSYSPPPGPTLDNAEAAVTPGSQPVVPVRTVNQWSKYTEEVTTTIVVKLANAGGLNSGAVHPHAFTEHQEGVSAGVLGSVAPAGNTDAGQVFRASQSNVDSAGLRLSVTGAGAGLFSDDFEAYANEAALDAAWVQSDAVNTPATLEAVTVHAGTQAMAITISKNLSLADTLTLTFAAEDWAALEDLLFWIRSDQVSTKNQVSVRIGDGVNTKSIAVPVAVKNVWEERTMSLALFVEDGVGVTNMAAITTVEFEVLLDGKDGTIIIDDMLVLADPGTITAELWNAASAAPGTFGTLVATSAAVQLANSLDNRYTFEFEAATVVVGNYYLLALTAPSNVAVTVGVLGEAGNKYASGGAFTSADNGTTVVMIAGSDASFEVWARVPGLIVAVHIMFDLSPANSLIWVFAEDEATETIPRYFVHEFQNLNTLMHDFEYADKPYVLASGEQIEAHVQHALGAAATQCAVTVNFCHEPLTVYG